MTLPDVPSWRAAGPLVPYSAGSAQISRWSTFYLPSLLAVEYDRVPRDAEVMHLVSVTSYAVRQHMSGLPAVTSGPGTSVHDRLVVMYVPLDLRRNQTRTAEEAFDEFIEDVAQMHREGSPLRVDQNRLIDPLPSAPPTIRGFHLGDQR